MHVPVRPVANQTWVKVDGKKYFGESPLYDELGALARKVTGAEWGGDWTGFKDKPHIQMRRFNSISEARNEFERK